MVNRFQGRPLPRRLQNIVLRESAHLKRYITVYSVHCSRGCAHGRAWPWRPHIRLYLSRTDADRFLVIHELAHIANWNGRHDEGFYRHAVRIAKREGCLRAWLNWQGRNAKAAYRRMNRAA